MPFDCSESVISANTATAESRKPRVVYLPVDVTVIASGGGRISIRARGVDGNFHNYTDLTWGDEATMWAACPTTLTGATDPSNVGDPPPVNATGSLHLSAAYVSEKSIMGGTPKFPPAFPEEMGTAQAPMEIVPVSLILTGRQRGNPFALPVILDLWNPNLASRSRSIELHEGHLTVHLTAAGHAWVGGPFPSNELLARAVEIIQRGEDAGKIALAWKTIEAGIDRYKAGEFDGASKLRAKAEIKRVLPLWQAE